jgi:IclR family acetate operon transcriptional repressor
MRNDEPPLQTVDRALKLLSHLNNNEGPHQLRDLAMALSMDKAVVHRLLRTMAGHGYVEQDDATSAYSLGAQARALGRPDAAYLFAIAREPMRELTEGSGFSTFLTLPLVRDSVCVDRVEAQRTIRVLYEIGRRLPFHAGSPGKALLAAFDVERRSRALGDDLLERFTDNTIIARSALDAELARIAQRGYATSAGELEDGISGVAAVIKDSRSQPVAALSLSGLSAALPDSIFALLGGQLMAAARSISQRLGAPDYPEHTHVRIAAER